ncbi:hypothetical protein TrVE_jg13968 [Triparma verrucosa]|uniref:Uncharacterized protein n=1 Tax=Triparma verrucosa TaxID=1606542 RepID=A0A9W7FNB1_9STRA|nr:hypothetical protein TrVE_jg13968 [Triparma verrucosa]
MSKRTSEDLKNVEEIPDPNNLKGGDGEEEVFEGSELDSAAVDTPAVRGDDFMHIDDFRRLFVGFAMADTLVTMPSKVALSLSEMRVPDSLQTFGSNVFINCSKLVPSDIDKYDNNAVVAYLRSIQ